jgi:hypothetical protein
MENESEFVNFSFSHVANIVLNIDAASAYNPKHCIVMWLAVYKRDSLTFFMVFSAIGLRKEIIYKRYHMGDEKLV